MSCRKNGLEIRRNARAPQKWAAEIIRNELKRAEIQASSFDRLRMRLRIVFQRVN